MMNLSFSKIFYSTCIATVTTSLIGCSTVPSASTLSAPRKETVHAVTRSNQLVSFNAGQPEKLSWTKPITGLQVNEKIHGVDYRVAKGQLYALGSTGRIYRLDTSTGAATMVGNSLLAVALAGSQYGLDFNPAVDRIRLVSNSGQNMRAHPDTGALVDSDPNTAGLQVDGNLAYARGDVNAGKVPAIVGAAYTYNKDNDKLTTNYAIDAAQGTLVTQGTVEGRTPAISPNTGQLFTVGSLGTGALAGVSFDIADLSNAAFMAADNPGQGSSAWYEINLQTGKATLLGKVATKDPVVGIAIEP